MDTALPARTSEQGAQPLAEHATQLQRHACHAATVYRNAPTKASGPAAGERCLGRLCAAVPHASRTNSQCRCRHKKPASRSHTLPCTFRVPTSDVSRLVSQRVEMNQEPTILTILAAHSSFEFERDTSRDRRIAFVAQSLAIR